ncbi:helicase associated domain-containing protein [Streptomyces kebangsaanensis]|uniref:helicase associated domain-containing protein n=1 Tax=Streptomyces kebangsaanensis TaxID=864058 RepID=UPI00093F2F53|nr:helicase associated domain-containing protein [Streptomyces kebangsaanensis]
MTDLFSPWPAVGVVRLTPLVGETTLSFVNRLAACYNVTVAGLLSAVAGPGVRGVWGKSCLAGEVFLAPAVRSRLASVCRVPESHLAWALPSWDERDGAEASGAQPGVRFAAGSTIPAVMLGCRPCAAARTGAMCSVRLYSALRSRVCIRHQCWSLDSLVLDRATLVEGQVGLAGVPEVIRAHQCLLRLLRRRGSCENAFAMAQAVVASWWDAHWREEVLWPARLSRVRADLPEGEMLVLARDVVTYPEAVVVTAVLSDRLWRQRVLEDTHGQMPHTLAEVPRLLTELARRLDRPWLAKQLATSSEGALFAWVRACVRQGRGAVPEEDVWAVPVAHRPRGLAAQLRELRLQQPSSSAPAAGRPSRAEQAYQVGLAHARAYAARHGHLAVPKYARHEGFALGTWLANQRTGVAALPVDRAQALHRIDPWWNGPWPVSWRRTYHRALEHVRKHGPVDAPAGFPGTSLALGEWLHEQCSRFDELHVGQQRLLADLGIWPAHARSARPRRKSLAQAFAAGLEHAHAYAAVHGHLATSKSTRQDGFPLGQWLMSQRSRARMAEKETDRSRALSAIDPWWNPPWPMAWQRAYHHARKQCGNNQPLVPGDGFRGVETSAASWLYAQCALFEELHPHQQGLLREIGITAEDAQARQATQYRPTGTRIDFAVGLAHARDYAGVYGHLALPHSVQHNGFPLGRWLASKRGEAGAHARRTPAPWPGMQALAALDPWWFPPWAFAWQRDYHRLRLLLIAELEPPPKLRSWISERDCCTVW